MTPWTRALFQTQPSANCERRQAARARVLDDSLRQRERFGPELGLQHPDVAARRARAFGRRRAGRVLAREDAARERAVGDDADAVMGAARQQLGLDGCASSRCTAAGRRSAAACRRCGRARRCAPCSRRESWRCRSSGPCPRPADAPSPRPSPRAAWSRPRGAGRGCRPSRCRGASRLASSARTMCRRDRPRSLAPSPVGLASLVATTQRSRSPAISRPVMRSDSPPA